ncbi:MAG: hypothetical protein ACHQFX_16100 [Chitinophagales bacterium]
MKKVVIALVLAGGIGVIAFASLSNRNSYKQAIEKKTENKEKKECKKTCLFS